MAARSTPELDVIRVPGVDRLAEGEARKVLFTRPGEEVPGELLLCRVAGRLHALDTLCPHEGGRLVEGPLEEGRLAVCPLHLYKFDPRDGRSVGVECEAARTYPVREVRGTAEIVVGGSRDGTR
jgi:nitrite reductase/ring-hydroxylating ferredoxin subunit